MAVKFQAFLALEEALAKRLYNAWTEEAKPVLQSIAKLVDEGQWAAASDLVNSIDMEPAVRRNEKFIRYIGMSAVLFGASQYNSASKSSFARQNPPAILDRAVNTTVRMLVENGNALVRREAQHWIHEAEQDAKSIGVVKSERKVTKAAFSKEFVPSILKQGRRVADLGASLHASRLAYWGHMTEAELEGWDTYQITAVLDSATCPVCQLMDGKVFEVQRAKARVETLLSVTDPDDLKELAPWPSQDQVSLDELRSLSDAELVDRGLDLGPYHPNCRCLAQKTDRQVSVTMTNPIAAPQPEEVDQLNPVTEDLVVEELKNTYLGKLRALLGLGSGKTGLGLFDD